MKSIFLSIIFCLSINSLVGQHENENEHKRNSLSVVLNHSFISFGLEDGSSEWLALPAWGVNYNFMFNSKWGLGLHNDIILAEFVIENPEGFEIEREFPVEVTANALFKPTKHLGFLIGGGMEFSKTQNFGIIRFGFEPYFELPKHYELFFSLTYDIKYDAYNHWNLGLGVSKSF